MNIIPPDKLLLVIFVLNIFLVFLDAIVGYYLVPRLLRLGSNDRAERNAAVLSVRRKLSGLVALYMFINCMGYFRKDSLLLMIVAGMIAVDLGVQLFLFRRSERERKR
jgi:hypothetical protein